MIGQRPVLGRGLPGVYQVGAHGEWESAERLQAGRARDQRPSVHVDGIVWSPAGVRPRAAGVGNGPFGGRGACLRTRPAGPPRWSVIPSRALGPISCRRVRARSESGLVGATAPTRGVRRRVADVCVVAPRCAVPRETCDDVRGRSQHAGRHIWKTSMLCQCRDARRGSCVRESATGAARDSPRHEHARTIGGPRETAAPRPRCGRGRVMVTLRGSSVAVGRRGRGRASGRSWRAAGECRRSVGTLAVPLTPREARGAATHPGARTSVCFGAVTRAPEEGSGRDQDRGATPVPERARWRAHHGTRAR